MENQAITLLDLNMYIRQAVESLQIAQWVTAEISEISQNRYKGHCYLELVEKSPATGNIIARLRCTIWGNLATHLLQQFEQATGDTLRPGIKIMAYIAVSFHENYGLSGNIQAIDASYTLGDIERLRRETLARLEADGVMDMNRSLPLPMALQRIAIVSASSAAGYGDFCNQIANNAYSLRITTKLYPAIMQGATAEASIIEALDAIANDDEFSPDVVVIIRGGGSRADLACFDGYELASNIAQYPYPIITGIGHERDTSVADMVAHTRAKTPTAVAEIIIAHNVRLLQLIDEKSQTLADIAYDLIAEREQKLSNLKTKLLLMAKQRIDVPTARCADYTRQIMYTARQLAHIRQSKIAQLTNAVRNAANKSILIKSNKLEMLLQNAEANNPTSILKRGYTISTIDGHRITSATQATPGATITTLTADGSITSEVKAEA